MWARFTVLNETPIASAIAGCVIPLSRSSTIWMRERCPVGIFHRSAVFNCRICFLVHLTIRPPNQTDQTAKANHIPRPHARQKNSKNPSIQKAMEAVLYQPSNCLIDDCPIARCDGGD